MASKQNSPPEIILEGFLTEEPEVPDITDHPCYHGAISGAEAKEKLRLQGGNCYLMRYSLIRGEYILSVLTENKSEEIVIHNFTINVVTNEGYCEFEIYGTEYPFVIISDLLNFYEKAPVSHKVLRIGKPCIKEKKGLRFKRFMKDGALNMKANLSCMIRKGMSLAQFPHDYSRETSTQSPSPISENTTSSRFQTQATTMKNTNRDAEIDSHDPSSPTTTISNGEGALRHSDSMTKVSDETSIPRQNSQEEVETSYVRHAISVESIISIVVIEKILHQDMSCPSMSNLTLIQWKDAKDKAHDFRLISRVKDMWWTAGILLDSDQDSLDDAIISSKSKSTDLQMCYHVFSQWIKTNGTHTYPLTWTALCTLLEDIEYGNIAEKLKEILLIKGVL